MMIAIRRLSAVNKKKGLLRTKRTVISRAECIKDVPVLSFFCVRIMV